jgi:hypothetical protein
MNSSTINYNRDPTLLRRKFLPHLCHVTQQRRLILVHFLLFSRWVKLLTGISAGFRQESFGLFGRRIPTNGHLLESWAENGRSMFGSGERV